MKRPQLVDTVKEPLPEISQLVQQLIDLHSPFVNQNNAINCFRDEMMAALDTSWTYTFQGRNARGEIMCKLPQDKLKREVDCETEMENLESGFPAPQDSEDAAYIYRRFTKRSNMKIKKLKEEIKEHGVEKFAQKYLLLSDEDYEQQFNNNVTEIEIEDGKGPTESEEDIPPLR